MQPLLTLSSCHPCTHPARNIVYFKNNSRDGFQSIFDSTMLKDGTLSLKLPEITIISGIKSVQRFWNKDDGNIVSEKWFKESLIIEWRFENAWRSCCDVLLGYQKTRAVAVQEYGSIFGTDHKLVRKFVSIALFNATVNWATRSRSLRQLFSAVLVYEREYIHCFRSLVSWVKVCPSLT